MTVASTLIQRLPSILRAVVLIAIGLTVTFSALMHETFWFNRLLVLLSFATLAAVQAIAWASPKLRPFLPGTGGGAVAIDAVAAVVVLSIGGESVTSLTHTVAGWAIVSAIAAAVSSRRPLSQRLLSQGRCFRDSAIHAVVLAGLAVAVELTLGDQVMLIGFFGAYAMMAGVFLAIRAADIGHTPSEDPAPDVPQGEIR